MCRQVPLFALNSGEVSSKKLPCFPCQIQREIGDRPVLPVTTLRESKGVFRLVFGDIPLEGGGGFVFTALGLDGDDLCPILQYKVDLAVFVGIVARLHIKLPPKLLQNIVFCQRTFELVIALQENSAVVDPRHLLEQPGVKNKELELIQLVEGGKGMLHFGDVVDPVQHPGRDKPFYRLLKVPGSAAFTDCAVHKLFIGLGQLGHDAAEHHEDTPAVDLAVVLGEVIFVNFDQLTLDLCDFGRVLVLDPGSNALRHPADDEIIVVGFCQPVVEDILNGLLFLYAAIITV